MSEKLITLSNLQSYDEKIKNYIDQHSGNTGTTYTVSNTEGSTKLINDADGSEQEILPFYVESSDMMPHDNVYLSDRSFIWGFNTHTDKERPLFSSYTEWIESGGPMEAEFLDHANFEKNHQYGFKDNNNRTGVIWFDGEALHATGRDDIIRAPWGNRTWVSNKVDIYAGPLFVPFLQMGSSHYLETTIWDEKAGKEIVTTIATEVDLNNRIGDGRSLAIGEEADILTKGSVAMGVNVTAGAKAFYIASIDKTNKKIYLRNTNTPGKPTTGASTVAPLPETYFNLVGREFSIMNGTHYAFCSTITAVNNNVITYKNEIMAGKLDNSTLKPTTPFTTSSAWETIASVSNDELWKEYLFWIPSLPEFGFDIVNPSTGEQLFQGAQVFGDNNQASANGAFVAGSDNIAGGKGANVFGTRNRGAYANLIAGGDNFSNGQHSHILGRWNTNLSNHNFITNTLNNILAGQNHVAMGTGNKINSGTATFVTGANNNATGDHHSVFGKGNTVTGTNNFVANGVGYPGYTGNTVSGYSNAVFGTQNTSTGMWSIVGGFNNSAQKSHCYLFGRDLLNKSGEYQFITGRANAEDADAVAIFGAGAGTSSRKNALTIGRDPTYGTRGSVDTDAVTVKYFNAKAIAKDAKNNLNGATSGTVSGSFNILGGHILNVSGSYNGVFGLGLQATGNCQIVGGQYNVASKDLLIIGDGSDANNRVTVFTVPRHGTVSKSTDAITYGYLQTALLNGQW